MVRVLPQKNKKALKTIKTSKKFKIFQKTGNKNDPNTN